jgi:hypothetical protein
MEKTVVQELIEIISEVDNNLFSKDTIILALSNYLKVERMQITEAFVAGYQSAKMEDMIGGSGNEENEYYEETYLK